MPEPVDTVISSAVVFIYPNPARDYLFFLFNGDSPVDAEIVMINFIGQEVYEKREVISDAGQPFLIPIKNFSSGIYAVKFVVNGKEQVFKVVIE